ncbi:MAG: nucleotide exchange factor GrpE [Candidatus Brocadia sp. AMX2]|uniref:Protein GrpE n=1 Tax=Candidatus Brocadia sinica JPN1 TaxID=1197129 RepID=A0ABQ0K1Y4_9BACT|nr:MULTISPECIES: nucleotide exchange factor GrpE [Brocadia]KXK31898.1 MAG: putative co-chaperone GrpE [Candidatus Brocadia sinica]MBC6933285.1 nucleotide exchange factor GrpE [Candidatus Brocadia sp.]MBL1170162.1 nucleotide exchange factor GrpE [Candidatus Brocadia sp. AMX1]NOG42529.1 nucleotide exchange factor GrpE [Planctomycetota bacterium]KAA0242174.1 MAG: nucleotide exchange factor GrpE [Candidatus Brocadia sp. AMX2]
MSNETEKNINPSDKVEVVQASEVLFAEQQAIIQSLKQELEINKKRVAELQDSMRRLAADFDNYKKWAAKERQTIERTASESLIKKLLDIYESLEKAVCASKDITNNELFDGIKMIYKEFSRILKSEGLEPIPSIGLPLDVYRHEVLMQKINDEVPEDTVLEEIQRGYLLNTFVLRPAKVVVSQKSTKENVQNQEKPEEEKGG